MATLCSELPNDNPSLHRGVTWVCLEPTAAPSAERSRTEPSAPAAEATAEVAVEDDIPIELEIEPVESVELVELVELVGPVEPEPRPSGIVLVDRDDRDADATDIMAAILVEALEPVAAVSVEGTERAPEEPELVANDESAVRADEAPVADEAPAAEHGPVDEAPVADEAPVVDEAPVADDPFLVLVRALSDVAIARGGHDVAAMLPAFLLEDRLSLPISNEADGALRAGAITDGAAVTQAFARTTRAWRAILRGVSDDLSACGGASLDEWASDLLARLLGSPGQAATLRRELRARGVAAFGLIEAA